MTLLKTLYGLLSFVTEDARAHKLINLPPPLFEILDTATNKLGEYLDSLGEKD